MYSEEDFIPISALQHYFFCPRQCALIHIEQQWVENQFTADGRELHETVHSGTTEKRRNIRVRRTVPLCSHRLGIVGQADVVEFHRKEKLWVAYPVEYKRGKPKLNHCDAVQLCAQALCLEEMLGQPISEGSLFYGKTCRRINVKFDDRLLEETENTIMAVHKMIESGKTPAAIYIHSCKSCSLYEICMPKLFGGKKSVSDYLKEAMDVP